MEIIILDLVEKFLESLDAKEMAKTIKTKILKDPAVKTQYEALGPEYEIVKTIIRERIKRGWSQTELANAIGSRQPVISRLERGEGNPSLQTLQKIARALNLSLRVSMK